MKSISPGSIQQQMYTRERRGIFRSAEGFDTVAKSPGLEAAFIKKVLHPFCLYDAPAELTARSEKDGALYPESVHLFHAEGGETVLGRSIYQPVDFTGLRSAFFTHNYVIPGERSEEIVTNYKSLIEAAFEGRYDVERGLELPELPQIPHLEGSMAAAGLAGQASAKERLARLGLDELLFKQLLFAVMTASGQGRKKVYISLNVPIEDISKEALSLLDILYSCLPFEFRRRLGFLTYAKEPTNKKYIHLQFVEKGSLRPHDRNIEKDFVFDLAAERTGQMDLDWSRQPYLDLAWNSLEHRDRLEDFFVFADEMLEGMGSERKSALSSYHELAVFYQVKSGDDAMYEDHKLAVLRGLLDYLQPAGSLETRMELNDLFLSRFDLEFDRVSQGQIPDLAVAECFRDYFSIQGAGQEDKIIAYYVRALKNALLQERRDAADAFYALIEGHPGLDAAFFTSILANDGLSRALFEPYIQDKFNKSGDIKGILNLIYSWGAKHPRVLYNPSFQEAARNRLLDILRSNSQLLRAVNLILLETGKWSEGHSPADSALQDSGMVETLSRAASRTLLSELDLDRLTKEQLLSAEFLSRIDGKAWVRDQKDTRLSGNAAMLYALHRMFTEDKPDVEVFDGLGLMEVDRVQQIVRRWLQGEIRPSEFHRLALAFYRESESGFVEYVALFDYLRRNADNKEMIYEFMLWSQAHPHFSRPRGLVPAYGSAILAYFKRHDKSAFKSRDYRRNYFSKAGKALGSVFDKAKLELSSPLSRLLVKNRKAVVAASAVLCLLVIVIVGGLWVLKETGVIGKDDNPPATTDGAGDPVDPVSEPIVFAEPLKTKDDGKAETRLIFPFDDLAECKVFDPSALSIQVTGQEPQELSMLKFTSECSAGVPDNGNSEANDDGDAVDPSQNGNGSKGEVEGNEAAGKKTDPATGEVADPVTGKSESGDTGTKDSTDTSETDGTETSGAGAPGTGDSSAGTATSGTETGAPDAGTNTGTTGTDPASEPEIKTPEQYPGRVTVIVEQSIPDGSVITVKEIDYKVMEFTKQESEDQTDVGSQKQTEPGK
ncbi:glycosyltransferase [Paenibacillus sp. FSL R5-0407]|uniref:GAP1-N2 domain-containing protein n=1 Tax=Paenibacillus sp. FSL R5-0407 TaxID=2975320 RepID=UPI0030FCE806